VTNRLGSSKTRSVESGPLARLVVPPYSASSWLGRELPKQHRVGRGETSQRTVCAGSPDNRTRSFVWNDSKSNGTPGGIRTPDPQVRRTRRGRGSTISCAERRGQTRTGSA